MNSSKCTVRDSNKSRFIAKLEAEELLRMTGKILIFWFLVNIMIAKSCCNPNVVIRIFTMIMDSIKKAEKNQI